MKLRRCLAAGVCAYVLAAPSTLLAAPFVGGNGAVQAGTMQPGAVQQGAGYQGSVPASVVVPPNPGVGGQGVANPTTARGLVAVRPVVAAALVDQSSEQEQPGVGQLAGPMVAGEPAVELQQDNVATPQEPKRGWLRQARPAEEGKEESKSSSDWSMSVLALVLLGGLAGGAVVMKMRRGAPAPWLPPAAVRVLSTTRLTPKASLITAEVHGRVLLLGVTDESVTELGWLDGNASAESSLQTGEGEPDEDRGTPIPPNATTRAGFGQVLGNVFRAGERKGKDVEFRGNPNVAALIAARDTRDVVSTNYSRATAGGERRSAPSPRAEQESSHIETQVAGLARRRR